MARYRLQLSTGKDQWEDTEILFSTKSQLEEFIGDYGVDYDWRVGYTFKHYYRPMARFVWNSGKKKGEGVSIR